MSKIDRIFKLMIEKGSSDLHLHEGKPPQARVHGEIEPIADEIMTREVLHDMLSEIAGPERWDKFMKCGDLDFAYQMDENNRFRANYFKQVYGAGAVFRIIPTKILTLEQLGMPPVIKEFGALRSGIVLVTGPTGSGKSTTLAALIDHINATTSKHIVTIEEPIEFVHRNKQSVITQREVHVDTKSFKSGLKAALREDADVILVGEMRDLETISLALTAAETGMLVFGTLHTNNAQKTIDRIIDVFPSNQQPQVRTMLAASLRGVVAQLLMKRIDKPGRLAVNEILVCNLAVSAIIREGKTQKLMDVIVGGTSEGMQLMDDCIAQRLVEGKVSPVEAYMKSIDKTRFEGFLPKDLAVGT
ncbi:type IV pilus twitching motility protein PilT [Kamptonema cortianum]|nr:type IV pilus twitching motility protein PilT [Kamptonema cortianum]